MGICLDTGKHLGFFIKKIFSLSKRFPFYETYAFIFAEQKPLYDSGDRRTINGVSIERKVTENMSGSTKDTSTSGGGGPGTGRYDTPRMPVVFVLGETIILKYHS